MIKTPANPLERALTARAIYFNQGRIPDGLIDTAIVRSWERCAAAARHEKEHIEFNPVTKSGVSALLERNITLLKAAIEPVEDLARAIAGAGYTVLLTDSQGVALSVTGLPDEASRTMRQAFRLGVDLSERVIGTSAMTCAINERRPVRVFGPEHFFFANKSFHCAAAPIIAPDGTLLGAVDITRDTPKPDFGAVALVNQCANAIERRLFRNLHAFLTIELAWTPDSTGGHSHWMFAFGRDGEVLGMSEGAALAIGLPVLTPLMQFEEIFEGRFRDFVACMAESGGPVPIRFCSGVRLFARPLEAPHNSRPTLTITHEPPKAAVPIPEFGAPDIGRQIVQAQKAIAHQLPVLLLGETGVGKDVVARLLHSQSPRHRGPFIAINCAAIPESLIEGELFGHNDGAFTGARRGGSPGRIEQAHNGTLFLDEIGDMPPQLQSRLLRVLEAREVTRLGAGEPRPVNFQLICATLRPLEDLIRGGQFREDLFYRIDGYRIELPALRDRPNIARLITGMLDEISQGTRRLTDAALAALSGYGWPGNVRELRSSLVRAHSLAEPGQPLDIADFPPALRKQEHLKPPVVAAVVEGDDTASGLLSTLETQAIKKALATTNDDVNQAARLLGISRATMYRRLKAMRG